MECKKKGRLLEEKEVGKVQGVTVEDKEGLGIEPVMANEDLRQRKMEEGPGKTEGPV